MAQHDKDVKKKAALVGATGLAVYLSSVLQSAQASEAVGFEQALQDNANVPLVGCGSDHGAKKQSEDDDQDPTDKLNSGDHSSEARQHSLSVEERDLLVDSESQQESTSIYHTVNAGARYVSVATEKVETSESASSGWLSSLPGKIGLTALSVTGVASAAVGDELKEFDWYEDVDKFNDVHVLLTLEGESLPVVVFELQGELEYHPERVLGVNDVLVGTGKYDVKVLSQEAWDAWSSHAVNEDQTWSGWVDTLNEDDYTTIYDDLTMYAYPEFRDTVNTLLEDGGYYYLRGLSPEKLTREYINVQVAEASGEEAIEWLPDLPLACIPAVRHVMDYSQRDYFGDGMEDEGPDIAVFQEYRDFWFFNEEFYLDLFTVDRLVKEAGESSFSLLNLDVYASGEKCLDMAVGGSEADAPEHLINLDAVAGLNEMPGVNVSIEEPTEDDEGSYVSDFVADTDRDSETILYDLFSIEFI